MNTENSMTAHTLSTQVSTTMETSFTCVQDILSACSLAHTRKALPGLLHDLLAHAEDPA